MQKKCRRCGNQYDEEAFFRKNTEHRRNGQVYLATHSICIGCELTERNDPTPQARALRKARNSLRHHAEKYDMAPQDFAAKYGWNPERMMHNILHSLENTCTYCWCSYDEMGHGLDDITLDVVDRSKEPYYHTNVQWCCRTCNQEKSTLSPEIWARRLIEWRRWRQWQDEITKNPFFGLPLFEPTNAHFR